MFMMGFKKALGSRLALKYQAAIESILLFKRDKTAFSIYLEKIKKSSHGGLCNTL